LSIKKIPTHSLRTKQSLVEQETYLFNDTILNNIKIGRPDASLEEIIQASKKASVHNFIEILPLKYETGVGELGGQLSSGERQCLGLARAFLHEGEVLILDEPTSFKRRNDFKIYYGLYSQQNHYYDFSSKIKHFYL